jgi:hypothetical protein
MELEGSIVGDESVDGKKEDSEALIFPHIKTTRGKCMGLVCEAESVHVSYSISCHRREYLKLHFNYLYVCTMHFV